MMINEKIEDYPLQDIASSHICTDDKRLYKYKISSHDLLASSARSVATQINRRRHSSPTHDRSRTVTIKNSEEGEIRVSFSRNRVPFSLSLLYGRCASLQRDRSILITQKSFPFTISIDSVQPIESMYFLIPIALLPHMFSQSRQKFEWQRTRHVESPHYFFSPLFSFSNRYLS